jgi:four helix bundle protein
MGVRDPHELRAWQRCYAVRRRLLPILRRPEWYADQDLRSQIRRAIRSACSNVSEGFWRYQHPEFAHFVKIARSSLGELRGHLEEAAESNLITPEESHALDVETDAALRSVTRLLIYLRSTKTPSPTRPTAWPQRTR